MAPDKRPCPFCGSAERRDAFATGRKSPHRWLCGTIGPDDAGDYFTSVKCDTTVFRNEFLRCHDLLRRVITSPVALLSDKCVTIEVPASLYDEIAKEVSGEK